MYINLVSNYLLNLVESGTMLLQWSISKNQPHCNIDLVCKIGLLELSFSLGLKMLIAFNVV